MEPEDTSPWQTPAESVDPNKPFSEMSGAEQSAYIDHPATLEARTLRRSQDLLLDLWQADPRTSVGREIAERVLGYVRLGLADPAAPNFVYPGVDPLTLELDGNERSDTINACTAAVADFWERVKFYEAAG